MTVKKLFKFNTLKELATHGRGLEGCHGFIGSHYDKKNDVDYAVIVIPYYSCGGNYVKNTIIHGLKDDGIIKLTEVGIWILDSMPEC